MTRWLSWTALAAVLVLTVQAADEKENAATKAFTALQAEFEKEWKAARRDAEKQKAVVKKYSPLYLEHAKKNAKDESAVLALEAVLQLNTAKDKSKVREEALDLLKKDYVKSKHIESILRTLAVMGAGTSGDADAMELLKAVVKDNPDKIIRAIALEEWSSSLEFRTIVVANLERDDKLRASYESQFGEAFVKKLLDSANEAKKESETLRKTLKTDYADVIASNEEPNTTPKKNDNLKIGAKAPEVTCVDIDGKPVKLSDLKGKVVVLDFWATWCGPCRAMIPHTQELVKRLDKKPFVFVSISVDARRETALDFVNKNDMPWTHWWDGRGGKVSTTYEVSGFPTIYAIDHKGVIRFSSLGFDKTLDSVVEKLVKEAEADKK